MSNGTNVSLLATTTTMKTEEFPWYTAVVTAFILPPIVVSGLIGNILTLIILLKYTESVPEKARLNMIILAAYDSIALMFYPGRLVFSEGLYILTGGNFYSTMETKFSLFCKGAAALGAFGGTGAGFTLIGFCLERYISIKWPMQSRTLFQTKQSLVLLFLVAGPVSLFAGVSTGLGVGILPTPLKPLGLSCRALETDQIMYILRLAAFLINEMNPIILTIINIGLLGELRKAAKMQKQLSKRSTPSSQKDTLVAIISVIMAMIRCIILFPVVFFQGGHLVMGLFQTPLELSGIRADFNRFGNAALRFSSIGHASNFYIYFWRIPAFRKALKSLCCKRS